MPNTIREIKEAYRYADRRCEVCRRGTGSMSNLCKLHRYRRNQLGSVKVTRQLRHKDYAHLIGLATKYFKTNPPPSAVLESMARFLQPPAKSQVLRHNLIRDEMSRWSDPRYRKRVTDHGKWSRKADYSPRGVLAVLVAVQSYIDERSGVGFPHQSEHVALMFAVCRLWKRPRGYSNGPKGRKNPTRFTTRTSATVLRELVKRWRDFTMLNTFVLVTARAILAELKASEAERIKHLPKTYTQEEMRVLHDKQKREAEAREFEKQRAAFLAGTPVADPGPRTFGPWDGTAEMQRQIMAWSEATYRYNTYLRRRQKFDVR